MGFNSALKGLKDFYLLIIYSYFYLKIKLNCEFHELTTVRLKGIYNLVDNTLIKW